MIFVCSILLNKGFVKKVCTDFWKLLESLKTKELRSVSKANQKEQKGNEYKFT